MHTTRTLVLMALMLVARTGWAASCELSIEADDRMQFNSQRLEIDTGCADVQLTLHHVGKQPASVMGHNWVLARTADVGALASAGIRAGRANNYQPPNDPRIIAATPVVGGGESATVHFAGSALKLGESYTFFCSSPGHHALMRGAIVASTNAGRLSSTSVR